MLPIPAAVKALIRTVRRCLPVGDDPESLAAAAPWELWCQGDYVMGLLEGRLKFGSLLLELPPRGHPDLAIRSSEPIAPVERDLRAACRLLDEDPSDRWDGLRVLLHELRNQEAYSWRWDGHSDRFRGGPFVILVRRAVVDGELLGDLRRAADEAGNPTQESKGPPRTDGGTAKKHLAEPAALPVILSAPDLARLLNLPVDRLESALRRFRTDHPDCFEEVENRKQNEPKYIYRTADIRPVLQRLGVAP